jgi:hypothetical protein
MPTAIIRPGYSTATNMTRTGGTSAVSVLDPGDPPSPNDATYMSGELNALTRTHCQGVPEDISAWSTVTIKLRANDLDEGNCTERGYLRIGGSGTSSIVQNTTGSSFQTKSAILNPPGYGTNWKVGLLTNNSTACRFHVDVTGDAIVADPRIAGVWVEGVYTQGAKGYWAWLNWLPPIIAAGHTYINSMRQIDSVFRTEAGVPYSWVETIPTPKEFDFINVQLKSSLS